MDIINIGMITLESLSWSSVALAASILLVVYFVLTMVVRPYRDYLFYKKVLTANYKAKIMPFKVISKLYMDFMKGDYDKKGYGTHFKGRIQRLSSRSLQLQANFVHQLNRSSTSQRIFSKKHRGILC